MEATTIRAYGVNGVFMIAFMVFQDGTRKEVSYSELPIRLQLKFKSK